MFVIIICSFFSELGNEAVKHMLLDILIWELTSYWIDACPLLVNESFYDFDLKFHTEFLLMWYDGFTLLLMVHFNGCRKVLVQGRSQKAFWFCCFSHFHFEWTMYLTQMHLRLLGSDLFWQSMILEGHNILFCLMLQWKSSLGGISSLVWKSWRSWLWIQDPSVVCTVFTNK